MESANNSLQAIDLNPSCLDQVHYNKPGIGHGIKARSLDVFTKYSVFHLGFFHWATPDWCAIFSFQVGQIQGSHTQCFGRGQIFASCLSSVTREDSSLRNAAKCNRM